MLVVRTGWVGDMAETDVVEKGGKGVGAILAKKVGPMPVAAWAGVLGVAGYYIYRTRKGSGGTAAAGVGDGSGTVAATGSGSYTPTGSGTGSGGTGSGTSGTGTFADNQAWSTAAISYLVGLGYEGVMVNQAVQKYLASLPLTSAQQGMVNLAILKVGAPPELVAPSQDDPGGTTNPKPGIPAAVTGLKATVIDAHNVQLNWNPSDGAAWYEASITNETGAATVVTYTPSFHWDQLLGGYDSVYHVVAVNNTGRSPDVTVAARTPNE